MKFGSSMGPPGPARDAMRLGRAMSMPNPMDSKRALAKGKGLGSKMQRMVVPPPGGPVPRNRRSPEQVARNQRNPKMPYGAKPTYYKRDRFGRKIPVFETGQPQSAHPRRRS